MTRALIRLVAVVGALCALLGIALAHEFYDPWCCDGKDCKPYAGVVEVTPDGFFVPEFNQLIPFKNAAGVSKYAEEAGTRYNVPETAAEYHICMMPYDAGKIRCFYAKPGGV